jgi:hypothetical protein
MQVNDQLVNQMLRNLPQDQQNQFASVLRNEVAYEVVCNTTDVTEERDVPTLDESGEKQYFKTGEKAGQVKTHKENVVVQRGTNGRVIAHIMKDGQVVPLKDENGDMWLRSSRRRTDGEYGFECWCGLDSRIAPNEAGILKADGTQPTKEDLYHMAENLQNSPPKYATINHERDVDGFILRKVGK